MAKMYPSNGPKYNDSYTAEPLVYHLLKEQLSDDYHVIHSIPWLSSFVVEFQGQNSPIGEIDFLILHPKLGLLALEVKGGHLNHSENGFYYSRAPHYKVSNIDPITQLNRGIFAIQNWLRKSGINIRIGRACYFPQSETELSKLPPSYYDLSDTPISLVIDIKDNGSLSKKIKELMIYYKDLLKFDELSENQLQTLIEKILPSADYTPCWLSRIQNDHYLWLRLTEEQRDCINTACSKSKIIVTGWPGSGKTIVAIQTARKLAQQKQKVLFLTFNKLLSEKLKSELRDTIHCKVIHLHALCRDAAKRLGTTNSIETKNWLEIGAFEDLSKAQKIGFLRDYDCLIVDEGQVINPLAWSALFTEFNNKKITIMCDAFQTLEYEKSVTLEWLEELLSIKAFTLTNSLRIPKKVCDRLKLFHSPNYSVMNPREREDDTLVEIVTPDPKSSLKQFIAQLQADNTPLDLVTVLTPSSMAVPADLVPQEAHVETIGRFRGLEKPIIIIMAYEYMSKVEFFCGYSRATSRCIVILDAYNVKNGKYGELGAELYKDNETEIEEKINQSLTSNILKYCKNETIHLLNTLPLYWSETWKCYVVPPENEVLRLLFISFLFENHTPHCFTWSDTSRNTIGRISTDPHSHFMEIPQELFELRGCLKCCMKTPQRLSKINGKTCEICELKENRRDYEFEHRMKALDEILSNPEEYTQEERRNIPTPLYAIGAIKQITSKINIDMASDVISVSSKPITRTAIALIIVYLYRKFSNNVKEIKVGETAKEIYKWNFNLSKGDFNSWNGYVNDAFKKLEDRGYITSKGKGIREINSIFMK